MQKIAYKSMPYDSDVEFGFITGLNCTKALKLKEIIPGNDNHFAMRTEDERW